MSQTLIAALTIVTPNWYPPKCLLTVVWIINLSHSRTMEDYAAGGMSKLLLGQLRTTEWISPVNIMMRHRSWAKRTHTGWGKSNIQLFVW